MPVMSTLPGDLLTPVLAYLRLTNGARAGESFLMESAVRGETSGRWSFVGACKSPRPFLVAFFTPIDSASLQGRERSSGQDHQKRSRETHSCTSRRS